MTKQIHIVADESHDDATPASAADPEAEARALAEAEQVALFVAWLPTQSETVQALAAEWASMGHGRFALFETTHSKNGRRLYNARALNGYTQSYTSYEHALFKLVDAFRTRVEDLESTIARVVKIAPKHPDLTKRIDAEVTDLNSNPSRHGALKKAPSKIQREHATLLVARRFASEIASKVRVANPQMPGEERDVLVLAEIKRLEKDK